MQNVIFSYTPGSSLIYRINGLAKLIVLLCCAAISFFLDSKTCLIVWGFLVVFSLTQRLSVRQMLKDLLPVLWYFLFLYAAILIQNLLNIKDFIQNGSSLIEKTAQFLAFPEDFTTLLCRFLLSLQFTSLYFRTTSPLELHNALRKLENPLDKNRSTPLADTIALTINFIPGLTVMWHNLNFAWNSRNGSRSPSRIIKLVPKLIIKGMELASKKDLAARARL